jgi:polyisoprenoid-binding protein YceI
VDPSEWQLVPDSSTVRFIGVQEGSAFRGRFTNFSALIDFDPGNPTAGKIVGVVKMDSAKTGDEERDATLLEEDWFDPQNHPESRFESERVEQLDDGTFAAHGQLTLIGVTLPVTMSFEFEVADSTAHFSGSFDIQALDIKAAGKMRIRQRIFPAALISSAWILAWAGTLPIGSTTRSPFKWYSNCNNSLVGETRWPKLVLTNPSPSANGNSSRHSPLSVAYPHCCRRSMA